MDPVPGQRASWEKGPRARVWRQQGAPGSEMSQQRAQEACGGDEGRAWHVAQCPWLPAGPSLPGPLQGGQDTLWKEAGGSLGAAGELGRGKAEGSQSSPSSGPWS